MRNKRLSHTNVARNARFKSSRRKAITSSEAAMDSAYIFYTFRTWCVCNPRNISISVPHDRKRSIQQEDRVKTGPSGRLITIALDIYEFREKKTFRTIIIQPRFILFSRMFIREGWTAGLNVKFYFSLLPGLSAE